MAQPSALGSDPAVRAPFFGSRLMICPLPNIDRRIPVTWETTRCPLFLKSSAIASDIGLSKKIFGFFVSIVSKMFSPML